jgi:hypothetical protein
MTFGRAEGAAIFDVVDRRLWAFCQNVIVVNGASPYHTLADLKGRPT